MLYCNYPKYSDTITPDPTFLDISLHADVPKYCEEMTNSIVLDLGLHCLLRPVCLNI